MRSHVEVSFYRQGVQLGSPVLFNEANVHPDITDAVSWEDLVNFAKGIYHGVTFQWEDVLSDVKSLYETAIKNKNVNEQRRGDIKVWQGGVLGLIDDQLDEIRIWFRAWSEDTLTKSFGRVDPSNGIRDLGERFFNGGDEKWYEHGFSLPVTNLTPRTYIFSFASGDDGWHFDVGVASFFSVSLAPTVMAKHSGKVLEVSGASNDNGAPIIQYHRHGEANQIFRPEPVGNGYFRLVAQHSEKVLEVPLASTADGTQVAQSDWYGRDHQMFRFEPLGDGYVRIVAKHSGKVLDVYGAWTHDGAPVMQYTWNGGDHQRWLVPQLPPTVMAKHSGKVLEVSGASNDNGAPIIQYHRHGEANQIFRPEPVGNGYFRLVAQHSGKVLEVPLASTADGTQVAQSDWYGRDHQMFRFEPLGDGYVRIVAKHSGKVLDVYGAWTDDGAPVMQYTWNGGDHQRWLVPLSFANVLPSPSIKAQETLSTTF